MRPLDRWMLGLLTPVWAAALILSALSLDRDAVVSPFRAASAGDVSHYPSVSGLRPWIVQPSELQVGDRLVRVADVEVRGASAARVLSLAWYGIDDSGALALSVARGSRHLDVEARIPATIPKWPSLLTALVWGGVALFGLLRFPSLRVAQVAFPAFMANAIWMGSHFGETPQGLLAAFWLRAAALLFVWPLMIRTVRFLPEGVDHGVAWARGWPIGLGVIGPLVVDAALFGVLPDGFADQAGKLLTLLGGALVLAIGITRYRSANRTGRRRFKWLLLGVVLANLPGTLVATASAVRPELGQYFLPSQLAQVLIPISLGIAITRHQLFDIDRLLNVTLVALGTLAVLIGTGFVAGPLAVAGLSSATGVSVRSASVVLAVFALASALPLAGWALRRLDAWVLRERRDRERAIRDLLARLSRASKLREIGDQLVAQLYEAFGARSATLWVAPEGKLRRVASRGDVPPALSPARADALANRLGGDSRARLGEELQLPELRGHLLASLPSGHGDGACAGAIALGPARSGDSYDDRDRALLALVAERCAAAVTSIEGRELLREARALNRALAAESERATLESEEKTRMLAAASHDARQPLQALRLFLGTLESRIDDRELLALVGKAQLSAITMQQTFEALLDQARLDAGALEPRIERIELRDAFAELESFLEPQAHARGLELVFRPTALGVRSDPALLRSILQNIVANAIRYTDEGSVEVRAVAREGAVEIEISDSGRGMTELEQARLFEPGTRGESAAGDSGGAGIGLSIVARLADLLGHELSVSSEPGRGTRFQLRVEQADSGTRSEAALAQRPGDLEDACVWVIDDDPMAREAAGSLLARWCAHVEVGADAQALLARLPEAPPDFILLDYHLETGTGLEALDVIEAALGTVPTALVSADATSAAADAARARGLLFLRKPVTPVQLRALLGGLFEGRTRAT